jgi:hypothetical protein
MKCPAVEERQLVTDEFYPKLGISNLMFARAGRGELA